MMEHALPALMALTALGVILLGYPVALALAGTAGVFLLVADLPPAFFKLLVSRIFANALSNWLFVAVPMFIFMGLILQKSAVAEKALRSAQEALGGSPFSMALSVLLIGTLLAASSGIVGASVILLTILGLPRLIEAGFNPSSAGGLVASAGTIAILIPPSLMLIILGDQMQTSIPALFAGAIAPGLLLICLYAAYVALVAPRQDGPAQRPSLRRLGRLLGDIAPLVLLILTVLGSILGGFATPTEASGVGALGAIMIAALNRKAHPRMIFEAARETASATSMVIAVVIGATCFAAVFRRIGGEDMIEAGLNLTGGAPWTILFVIMCAVFLLGFFLDWLEITLILVPILVPIVSVLDFGNGLEGASLLIWFGILMAMNLQMSFMTPPFGVTLFYIRGATTQVDTLQLYRGVIPFVALQLLCLCLVAAFPSLVFVFD